MTQRYQVDTTKRYVGHPCCFAAAVVDTNRAAAPGSRRHETVGEFYDAAMAQKVADALNAAEKPS